MIMGFFKSAIKKICFTRLRNPAMDAVLNKFMII